jgi:hypothetical protein
MIKVQVLTQCEHCNGEAYVPIGEAEDCQGHKYTVLSLPNVRGSNEPSGHSG